MCIASRPGSSARSCAATKEEDDEDDEVLRSEESDGWMSAALLAIMERTSGDHVHSVRIGERTSSSQMSPSRVESPNRLEEKVQ